MTDYELPKAPEIEDAWRAAFRALQPLVPERAAYVPEHEALITEVISQFPFMVREAELAAAAAIGPLTHWEGPPREKDWELVLAGIDFDTGDHDFGPVKLNDSAYEGPDGDWSGGSLDHAAKAYRRECGWDFAPGMAGIWLLMLAPAYGVGFGDGPWTYTGHLAGFVILYDRDEDDAYESVGHVWTASAWRRQGIARRLLAEARQRFSFTKIEGPYTEDGAELVASWQASRGRA